MRLHPAELATLGILAVVTATLAFAVMRGAALVQQAVVHGGLLLGFAGVAWVLARRPDAGWTPVVRGLAVIATMFTLYSTLGHIAFEAIPWLADPALDATDRTLFLGRSPALLWSSHPAPRTVEFLSFFYGAYIPFLYMSILLGLVARPPAERDEFVTAVALLYALSFLGYLFLPARGPIVELAHQFPAELRGATFHSIVVNAIESMGGPHGAFPSLHVGATFLVVSFDLKHRNLLRGLIYIPLLVLIAIATVVLRYHWVVDLWAGVLLALLAGRLAPVLLRRWRARLQTAVV
ncbi:MAG TPA: phosphatase PAP2 family protein [Longimicrobiales bacterium]|nr:phosphatase PAP2 family protein [Longimicrobiales bacterium]